MDHILELMMAERAKLDGAIKIMQGDGAGSTPTDFSLTAFDVALIGSAAKRHRIFTAEQRKTQAAKMRAYCKNRRASAAQSNTKSGKRKTGK